MQPFRLKCALSLSLSFSLLVASTPLWAQWAWRDSNGSIQYSDTPPPSSVPQNRILRQPGIAPETTRAALPDAPASSSADETSTPRWVEQNAEFMKRREQRQEQEKKEKEQRQAAEEKKKNCVLARENLRLLETGRPIRQPSVNGGTEYMNDSNRAEETKQIRDYLKGCD